MNSVGGAIGGAVGAVGGAARSGINVVDGAARSGINAVDGAARSSFNAVDGAATSAANFVTGQEPMQESNAMTTYVTCPPGVRAGSMITTPTTDGRLMNVVIPPGVQPGQRFAVQEPPRTGAHPG